MKNPKFIPTSLAHLPFREMWYHEPRYAKMNLEAWKHEPLMKDTIVLRVYRTTSQDTIRNTDPFGKGFREDAFLKYPITWDRSWHG